MSSTSFILPTTTTIAPAVHALTTPFVQAPECSFLYDLTSTRTWDWRGHGSSKVVTLLVSDAANPQFPSCQPSGWESGSDNYLTFSPAVCPSGWVYHEVATDFAYPHYSTAYCCASGYGLWGQGDPFPVPTMTNPCTRKISPNETTITVTLSSHSTDLGPAPTHIFTEGIIAHNAWHISWHKTDTPTLSPSLPELTSGKWIPTWVPGQTIAPGEYDREPEHRNENPGWEHLVFFEMIGLPIIGVAVIACSIWGCIACRRARRKERMMLEKRLEERLRLQGKGRGVEEEGK